MYLNHDNTFSVLRRMVINSNLKVFIKNHSYIGLKRKGNDKERKVMYYSFKMSEEN